MGRRLCFDIECSDLLTNMLDWSSLPYKLNNDAQLHCVVFKDIDTGEVISASENKITKEWMQEVLADCDVLSGINIIKFDMPVLFLFGVLEYDIDESTVFGRKMEIVDVLILSRLFHPDRRGGHSLRSWGLRLGEYKDDFRKESIESNLIPADAPKGAEFKVYSLLMLKYCTQDTNVTIFMFKELEKERLSYPGWENAIRIEHRLANIGIMREIYGFSFDKNLALELVEDLQGKMTEIRNKIEPILPPKPMNATELKYYSPPKIQLKKDGTPSSTLLNFCQKHNLELKEDDKKYYVEYKGQKLYVPLTEPLETELPATLDNVDWVKTVLLDQKWVVSEWRERDLTIGDKKAKLPYPKRIEALRRYIKQLQDGKYTKYRLKYLGLTMENIYEVLSEKLKDDRPVRVPSSPSIRIGVTKELDPNLEKLGAKVAWVADYALYLTYRHRLASIAGGDIEDMDLATDEPNTGFLAHYNEISGRINTPAIEIGATTNRYTHKVVVNLARNSSTYGTEIRRLFKADDRGKLIAFDYSSLELNVFAEYVYNYPGGKELAKILMQPKPHDWHQVSADKFNIPRTDCKSLNYGILYSAQPKKISQMLDYSLEEAKRVFNEFWVLNAPLAAFKERLMAYWEKTGKKYVLGKDGRKIHIRSPHAAINSIFQSCGSILARYTTVYIYEEVKKLGYNVNPFKGDIEFSSCMETHDDVVAYMSNTIKSPLKIFKTEEEAKEFVKNWEGEQLSAIGHGKNDTYYVALPNPISKAILIAVDRVNKEFKMKIPLQIEWAIGRSLDQVH